MANMDDSMAQARPHPGSLVLPAWKTVLSVASAVLLALLFLVSGVWKLVEPFDAAARMIQAKVPAPLGLVAAIAFGIAEAFAAILLLVPRFRRWGAWLTGLLLIAFMVYIGYYYKELTGADCSCFPWIKRAVGPGFFISDGIMLLMAVAAGVWARKPESKRGAVITLGAICVFALASLGITYARQTGAPAPESITVEGRPYSLAAGKHLIYFFDPECAHCVFAAREMSKHNWKETTVIGVPTVNPQWGPQFLQDTGLKAYMSSDIVKLRKAFPFGDAPFAVAVENGRQKQSFIQFEGDEPARGLRAIGFIE
jgi:uncharacterized membrane protein YphA (DoxX/SURF4 family)